jgi:hypothetical protein
MKETSAILMASVGKDCFEPGAVSWGFNSKQRIENIIEYSKFGVNAGVALITDLSRGIYERTPEEEEELFYVLDKAKYGNFKVMFIGPRVKTEEMARAFTGRSKVELKANAGGQGRFFDGDGGKNYISYRPRSSTNPAEFVLDGIHPDFKKLVKEGNGKLGLCVSPGTEEACCGCFGDEKFRQVIRKGKGR